MSKRFIMGRRFILGGTGTSQEGMPWSTGRFYWQMERWMVEHLGFEMRNVLDAQELMAGAAPLPEDTEIICLHIPLHRYNVKGLTAYLRSCPNARVILIPGGDRRMWNLERHYLGPFLERVAVILDCQKESWPKVGTFAQAWPLQAKKHVYFPDCINPEEWYNLEYNETPINKCILSGRIGGRYELRNFILGEMATDEELQSCVDVLKHPNFTSTEFSNIQLKKKQTGRISRVDTLTLSAFESLKDLACINQDGSAMVKQAYAELLHEYLGGLAIVGNTFNKVVISKHIEVVAVGSLMISEHLKDLDRMGFIPNYHYLEVNKQNVVKMIKDVCANPEKFSDIRRQGKEFVWKHHKLSDRLEWMKQIVDDIMSENIIEEKIYE